MKSWNLLKDFFMGISYYESQLPKHARLTAGVLPTLELLRT